MGIQTTYMLNIMSQLNLRQLIPHKTEGVIRINS